MTARLYLTVYARDDMLGASLGTVDAATELEFTDTLHGTGSGRVRIARHHPQADLLQQDRYCRVHSDAGVIGAFFLEQGTIDLSASEGTGDEWLEWIGRGPMAILETAVMDNDSDIVGGEDPIDGFWDLSNQGPLAGNSSAHPITMFKRAVVEAKLQTPTGLGGVDHSSFTYDEDSNGDPLVFIDGEWGVNVGDDLLTVLRKLDQIGGVTFRMSTDFELSAWLTYGTDRSGAFGAGNVRFEKAVNIATAIDRKVRGGVTRTHLIVGGADRVFVTVTDPDYTTGDVIRWGFLSVPESSNEDALESAGLAHIEARKRQTDVWVIPAHDHGDDEAAGIYEPGTHYFVGDTVTVHTGSGAYDANEVADVVASVTWKGKTGDEANEDYWVIVEIGSTFAWEGNTGFDSLAVAGSQHQVHICRDGGGSCIDTFTRTEASPSWGVSEINGWEWENQGGIDSVNGTEGIMSNGQEVLHADATWSVPINILIKARFIDFDVGNPLTLQLFEDGLSPALVWSIESTDGDIITYVDGTSIDSTELASGVDMSDGADFWMRAEATHNSVALTVWRDGDVEPSPQATDSDGAEDLRISSPGQPLIGGINRLQLSGGDWAIDSLEVVEGLECGDSCIHGGPGSNSGDATVPCGQCVAAGNHEHDYVAEGGTTGQVLKKASDANWDTEWGDESGGVDLSAINFLVGTASGDLSAEIVVGTTPGGELGGTWASPTVDATHSGSAHHTESHQSRHANGGADEVPVEGLPTAETDTALVLHPDGAGGIEWGTDEGGGGAGMAGELITDTFTGDGAEDTFTLSEAPTGTWAQVSINGSDLLPSEFAITGGDVVFDTAPDNLAEVLVTFVAGGFTAPAVDPGDIADPTMATAEDAALKVNELMANLRTAGIIA